MTAKFKNLVELYEASVSKFGDRELFGVKKNGEWKWSSYREFGEQVDAIRGGLASLGVTKGDRVAIIANNRPEWAIAAYAAYGLGASFVPMYEAQHEDEWEYILRDCGAKVAIGATDAIRKSLVKLEGKLDTLQHVIVLDGKSDADSISFDDLLAKGRSSAVPALQPDSKDIAGFIYTSGTTGNPKGVLLSHGNLASNVSAMHEVFPMTPEDRSLSFLPWAHSFGQTVEMHGLISMGASMAIAESRAKIVENLGEVKPTLLFSVPAIFNKIYTGLQARMAAESPIKKWLFGLAIELAIEKKELAAKGKSSGWVNFRLSLLDKLVFSKVRERFGGRLKYAFSGGAAIAVEVANFIDNLGITVYEGYGLTETSPIATANWPGSRKIGSVGKPIPGVRIELDKSETKDPVNGEIVVHGHNVMQGYHNLPGENEKVFTPDGGFRTGDMGRIDEDGFLFITGRIKEQYKLENGKYVVPSPLEDQLKLSSYIANAMVYGDNKPFNVALVVPNPDALKAWAQENGVNGSDLPSLAGDAKVRELIAAELDRCSGDYKSFEKIKKFALITEDFTTENGMLTPKMSLKRKVVIDRYKKELDQLYAG